MSEQQCTNEELAAMLRKGPEGVGEFNAYRGEHPDQEINFSGYDFSDLKLVGVNLEHDMKLNNTNFSDTDLEKANFRSVEGQNLTHKSADTYIRAPLFHSRIMR